MEGANIPALNEKVVKYSKEAGNGMPISSHFLLIVYHLINLLALFVTFPLFIKLLYIHYINIFNIAAPTQAPQAEPLSGKAALNARLEKLINHAPVMLFMKGTPDAPQCGFSNKIAALLKQEGTIIFPPPFPFFLKKREGGGGGGFQKKSE